MSEVEKKEEEPKPPIEVSYVGHDNPLFTFLALKPDNPTYELVASVVSLAGTSAIITFLGILEMRGMSMGDSITTTGVVGLGATLIHATAWGASRKYA